MKRIFTICTVVLLCGIINACGGSGGGVITEPIVCSTAFANQLDEGNGGDTSNDRNNPTYWALGAGANVYKGSTVSTDDDYITFNIGQCDTLTSITLDDFNFITNESIGFIALQQGTRFSVTPDNAVQQVGSLMGYTDYGRNEIGGDILELISNAEGSRGFTAPLPAGDYTMWLNQTGAESQFTLVFNVARVSP